MRKSISACPTQAEEPASTCFLSRASPQPRSTDQVFQHIPEGVFKQPLDLIIELASHAFPARHQLANVLTDE